MNDLVTLYSDLKRDIQGITKSLVKISENHSHKLTEEWNRKPDVMRIMGISARTLNRLTASGRLPFSKVNGIVYIKTIDVQRLLNENYHNNN